MQPNWKRSASCQTWGLRIGSCGAILIRDDYFLDYAQELADDQSTERKERDMYRVIPSDCRTGWLVVDGSGRKAPGTIVYRSRETAAREAEYLNRA